MGRYVAETGATVRQAPKIFGISKSTAHKDLTVRLKSENAELYARVQNIRERTKFSSLRFSAAAKSSVFLFAYNLLFIKCMPAF